MVELPDPYDPTACERDARAQWAGRRFLSEDGTVGDGDGPRVWQFEGTFAPGDRDELVAQRAVVADVDARYLAIAGRRAVGTLRCESYRGVDPEPKVGALLTSLGIWTGGSGGKPWDRSDRTAESQRIVSRLARAGLFVLRDEPFRVCPSCAAARSPGRIVYRDELGPTYLVRFPVTVGDREVHALAWVDAPWRLLGTSALLLRPESAYVIARYRRRDSEERVLTSRASLPQLGEWLPGGTFEIEQELSGVDLSGTPYAYPLRHEFPMGGGLAAPAGTLQVSPEVSETGTGIVPLVPGHGGTDAQIAEKLGLPGWPLLTIRGRMDVLLLHKYSGLDLPTTDEFVVRDLKDSGAIFAELKVRRGVPHCAICGSTTVWIPGKAWCLEPGRLPPAQVREFTRFLPSERPLSQIEISAWPVSESTRSDDPMAMSLRECSRCERLTPPDGPDRCVCGASTRVIRRRLLPSIGGAISAWARENPMPPAETVRLYLGERRRAPNLVHHLTAIAGLEGPIGELSLALLPTLATDDVTELVRTFGADAVRAALLRSEKASGPSSPLADLCREERRRLERWWRVSRGVLASCDPGLLSSFARPIATAFGELEPVDRGFVGRWEKVRLEALAEYDRWAAPNAFTTVTRFLDTDLPFYLELVRERLALGGTPPTKQAALRTLVHVLRDTTVLLAPVVPHTAESIHRVMVPDRSSLFAESPMGVDRSLLADDGSKAWERWRSVLRAVRQFRARWALPRSTVIPSAVLVLASEDEAERFRTDRAVVSSLAGIGRLEVASPKQPWAGRRRELRPIEAEIQRAYPQLAAQMMAMLRRMPMKRTPGASPSELTVVVGSHTYKISPSMVTVVDLLPDRVVPAPWSAGELYLELPLGVELLGPPMPPLSSDAFWLVRRIERRLRRRTGDEGAVARIALVFASSPLSDELAAAREPIARFLGLDELRVVTNVEESPPPGRTIGRTRTGARWWFDLPGTSAPRRPIKRRPARSRAPRVTFVPILSVDVEDFADSGTIAHAEAVRSLGQELDGLLGVPVLGPTKVAAAWDAGLTSVAEYAHAPFDKVASLPGFGVSIAEVLQRRLSGEPEARSAPLARPRRPLPPLPAPEAPGAHLARAEQSGPPPDGGSIPMSPASPESGPDRSEESSSAAVGPMGSPAIEPPAEPVPEVVDDTAEASEAPPERAVEPAPSPSAVSETASAVAPTSDELPTPMGEASPVSEPESRLAPPDLETTMGGPAPPQETAPSGAAPEENPLGSEPVADAPAPVADPTQLPTTPPTPDAPDSGSEHGPAPLAEVPPEIPRVGDSPPIASPAAAEAADAAGGGEDGPPAVDLSPSGDVPAPESPAPEKLEAPPPETANVAADAGDPVLEDSFAPPTGVAPAPLSPPAVPAEPDVTIAPVTSPTDPAASPEEVIERSAPPEPSSDPTLPEPDDSDGAATDSAPAGASPEVELPPVADPLTAPQEGSNPEGEGAEAPLAEPSLAADSPQSPPQLVPSSVPPEPPDPSAESDDVMPSLSDPPAAAAETLAPPASAPDPLSEAEPPATSATEAPIPEASSAPPAEEPARAPVEPAPIAPPPRLGGVEVLVGRSFVPSLQPFLDATAAGHRGVCIVRESPERLRAHVGSRPVEVYWLSNLGRGLSLKPGDLAGLTAFLDRSLVQDRVTAFFLEGVEYLVRLHGLERVLEELSRFDAAAREHEARVWVHFNPDLLPAPDLQKFLDRFGAPGGTGSP